MPRAGESAHNQGELAPPSPRAQTDLSGAVPRLSWDDRYRDELYSEIYNAADLPYRAAIMSVQASLTVKATWLLMSMPPARPRGFQTTHSHTPPKW